jgi:Protein of unknown function (DUF1573)
MIRALIFFGLSLCLAAHAADVAGVTFQETTYDFGTVREGVKVAHSFLVKNNTAEPVSVQRVQLSVPGMNARYRPVIPPGSEGTITLEWDTSHLSGEMDESATVFLADGSQENLCVKAIVQPPVEILPYPAIFLSAFRGEDHESRLRIVNHEEQHLALSLRDLENKHFAVSLSTIEPGRVYELAARISSATLPGRYDDELRIATDNPKLGQIAIPVHVFLKPDVYANPEAIDFGAISLATLPHDPAALGLLTQTFLVKKREGVFEIKQVESNVDGIRVTKDPPNGKSSTHRIDVALNPEKTRVGVIAGFLELFTDDSKFPRIRVSITGSIRP